jgi:hypothetical protein
MKKIALLLAAFLLAMMPATALAAGEADATPTLPDSKTAATETPAISFAIDNANIYSGMDKAYKDGYTPNVKDGVATIVLPLVVSGGIKGNKITVTPGLGDTTSSPFIYKNYQKTLGLKNNPVGDGSSAVSSYLVSFKLSLSSGRVNGVYPVTIDIQAQDVNGNVIQQTFTAYVTITDGKSANTSTETTAKPQPQPKIIVSDYSVSPSPVEAGREFAATVTLQNTSEKKYVQNMAVTITCDSPGFTLQNDSNVIYIEKLAKGKTTDIEIRYKTDLNTAAQTYNITLTMAYDNSDATTLGSSGTIPVAVVQPLRVKMTAPNIAAQVNAGDTMPLPFQVMNMGRSAVYNVRVELSAPGLIPTGTAFIGNMEAGTASTADMNVFIGTKDMTEGYEGEEKYGQTSGTITLIYEDASGKEYSEKTELSTNINEPVITASTDTKEEEPQKASQWWISIVIGAVIAAGLAAFLIARNRRVKNNADI